MASCVGLPSSLYPGGVGVNIGVVHMSLITIHSAQYLNTSARSLKDRIAILNTRGPGPLASRLQWMNVENFSGNNGDGTFNLHGFDIIPDPESGSDTLRFLLINQRPSLDPVTGISLNATKVGANSTVELFESRIGSGTMRYVKTYASPMIQTPNRVAWVKHDAFLFTNDHGAKVGMVWILSH